MAGNKLLQSVLMRIKQKLITQLIQDYHAWAATEIKLEPREPINSPKLSTEF